MATQAAAPGPVRIPLLDPGTLRACLEAIKAKKGAPPWSEALVLTDDIQAFLICHPPGQPNDTHYHLHDEWWVVLQGEIDWYIKGEPGPIARAGDFVFGPKDRWHHIEPAGRELTIRIAISARGELTGTTVPAASHSPERNGKLIRTSAPARSGCVASG